MYLYQFTTDVHDEHGTHEHGSHDTITNILRCKTSNGNSDETNREWEQSSAECFRPSCEARKTDSIKQMEFEDILRLCERNKTNMQQQQNKNLSGQFVVGLEPFATFACNF